MNNYRSKTDKFGIIIRTGMVLASFMLVAGCENKTSRPKKNKVTTTQPTDGKKNIPNYLVATIASFPPFVFRDKAGHSQGLDVDLLNAIGKEEGFSLTFLPEEWKMVLPSIEDGSRDIAATGIVITPEREKLYDFSDPYLDTGWLAVLKKPKTGAPYASFEAMRNAPNLTYVTQADSAGVTQLETFLSPEEMKKLHTVDTQFQEIKAVATGEADVAYDISRVLRYYMNQSHNAQLYGLEQPNTGKDYFGFVVKKGRTELQQKLDDGLRKIRENGTYDKIIEKYYGKQ